MRTIEIETGFETRWTLEIHDELENRIAASLGLDYGDELSDEDIKSFIFEHLVSSSEMLSIDIVKG